MASQRISSGTLKNRRLKTADGVTRPLTDRIKLAIVSTVQGYIEDAKVLDIFAGSGGFGFELLSRGAKEVTFIELNGNAMSIIRENASELNIGNKGRFHLIDALNLDDLDLNKDYDIIFLDPPFPLATELKQKSVEIASKYLIDDGVIILRVPIEDKGKITYPTDFNIAIEKEYGRSIVYYYTRKDN